VQFLRFRRLLPDGKSFITNCSFIKPGARLSARRARSIFVEFQQHDRHLGCRSSSRQFSPRQKRLPRSLRFGGQVACSLQPAASVMLACSGTAEVVSWDASRSLLADLTGLPRQKRLRLFLYSPPRRWRLLVAEPRGGFGRRFPFLTKRSARTMPAFASVDRGMPRAGPPAAPSFPARGRKNRRRAEIPTDPSIGFRLHKARTGVRDGNAERANPPPCRPTLAPLPPRANAPSIRAETRGMQSGPERFRPPERSVVNPRRRSAARAR